MLVLASVLEVSIRTIYYADFIHWRLSVDPNAPWRHGVTYLICDKRSDILMTSGVQMKRLRCSAFSKVCGMRRIGYDWYIHTDTQAVRSNLIVPLCQVLILVSQRAPIVAYEYIDMRYVYGNGNGLYHDGGFESAETQL